MNTMGSDRQLIFRIRAVPADVNQNIAKLLCFLYYVCASYVSIIIIDTARLDAEYATNTLPTDNRVSDFRHPGGQRRLVCP